MMAEPIPFAASGQPDVRRWRIVDENGQRWVEFEDGKRALVPPDKPMPSPRTFGESVGYGVKITPQGQLGYLRSLYGNNNAFQAQNKDMWYRTGPETQFAKYDPEEFEAADIGDLSGDVMSAGPGMVAGGLTLNPWAVAGADVAGEAARQGLSEQIPGEEELSPAGRGGRLALAGGSGLVSQWLGNVLGRSVTRGLAERQQELGRAAATPYAAKGERLAGQTGVTFTPGQQTGSRGQLAREDLARQHPETADDVLAGDVLRQRQAHQYLRGLGDRMDPRRSTTAETGAQVKSAFGQAVDDVLARRSMLGRQAARDLDDAVGETPIFSLSNTQMAIQQLLARAQGLGGSYAKRFVTAASEDLARFTGGNPDAPTMVTADYMLNSLSNMSRAMRSGDEIFEGLSDKAQNRFLAGQIYDALQADLRAASVPVAGVSEAENAARATAVRALEGLRNTWRTNSEALRAMQNSQLGRILGEDMTKLSDEDVVRRILSKDASQIRPIMRMVEDMGLVPQLRRAALQELFERSPGAAAQGGQFIPFSSAKFINEVQKNGKELSVIFGREHYRSLLRGTAALKRIYDVARGSQTAPRQMAMEQVGGLVPAGERFINEPGKEAARTLARALVGTSRNRAVQNIAAVMSDPQGLQALLRFQGLDPWSRAAFAELSAISAIAGVEQMQPPVNEVREGQQ